MSLVAKHKLFRAVFAAQEPWMNERPMVGAGASCHSNPLRPISRQGGSGSRLSDQDW